MPESLDDWAGLTERSASSIPPQNHQVDESNPVRVIDAFVDALNVAEQLIADAAEAYEAKRWPNGKVSGGKG